jgi:hypothetical protein
VTELPTPSRVYFEGETMHVEWVFDDDERRVVYVQPPEGERLVFVLTKSPFGVSQHRASALAGLLRGRDGA